MEFFLKDTILTNVWIMFFFKIGILKELLSIPSIIDKCNVIVKYDGKYSGKWMAIFLYVFLITISSSN